MVYIIVIIIVIFLQPDIKSCFCQLIFFLKKESPRTGKTEEQRTKNEERKSLYGSL